MGAKLIKFFAVVAGLQLVFALFIFGVTKDAPTRAILGMAIGLYVLWIIIAGLFMKKFRDGIRNFVQSIKIDWRLKFIIFSTILALIEEAITTAMTNTAGLYGVTMVQAHITASSNYWDVVLTNSVVLLVPMFCIWAWILSKYNFTPNQVFLIWGLQGTILEVVTGGPQHFLEIGLWMFVYGLMIYLPAYSIPSGRTTKTPKWWLYPLVFLVVFLGIIPGGLLATLIKIIRPPHFFPGIN